MAYKVRFLRLNHGRNRKQHPFLTWLDNILISSVDLKKNHPWGNEITQWGKGAEFSLLYFHGGENQFMQTVF